MNCCIECFHDAQIRDMIRTANKIGDCNFCGGKGVPVYPVDDQSDLSDLISEVISVYDESDEGESLFQLLVNDWHIFNSTLPSSYKLVEAFAGVIFGGKGAEYNKTVRIPRIFSEKYGIFSGHSWAEFSKEIKTQNRFHNDFFKPDQLASFLTYSTSKYRKGTAFYRARICESMVGYAIEEMGAPPLRKRRPGRVNPEGIGIFYLTSDMETALNEVRASAFDFVSIGEFRLKKDISVINISSLNEISPVLYSSGLESLAANISIFGDISKEISKPLRRSDSLLEYLPTQYITEFIKSKGYAGVEYTSTMGTGGRNVAVFDESLFAGVSVHNVEIKTIRYCYNNL